MQRNGILGGIAALAVLAGLGAAAWVAFGNGDPAGMKPDDEAVVARGETIYARECASCHGRSLEGQVRNWKQRLPDGSIPAPPHDATGHTWHHPDRMLFEVTKFGRDKLSGGTITSNMPGFEDKLSDAEIWAVLSYIKSRWPEAVQQRHDQINRQAAAQNP